MTDQQEFDRLMTAYFVPGTNELADRVLDAALDEIDHTRQRRTPVLPWRFHDMTLPIRLAAAAVIGVLAIGGLWYFTRSDHAQIGGPQPTAPASSAPAMWTPTATMPTDRYAATTTRLADGRILVAGGYVLEGTTQAQQATAEVYDPATGTWTRVADMATSRRYHTATLLPSGKVLVTGGGGGSVPGGDAQSTAELFDPASGTWSPAHAMSEVRGQHVAVLLNDGRVLVAGGNQNSQTGTAEIYDPASDTWTTTGDMVESRGSAAAALLTDGRVLVAGGFADPGDSAEVYDPASGTWTATGTMQTMPKDEAATLRLSDGRVLVVGGAPAVADIFDPTSGTWTKTGALKGQHGEVMVTALLSDGRVLLVGAADLTSSGPASAEIYDPSTDAWSAVGTMTSAPFARSATTLLDGRVVVVGSTASEGGGTAPVDVFDPTAIP